MSSIKLSPNASGTGALTIAAPNTNTDVTFNLGTALGNNGASALVSTDNAGNLGLGVTPSAWGYFKAAQVGVGSLVAPTNAANTVVYNNAFYDGSTEKYITSNAASQYQQIDGVHIWKRAPSGTAGNAISFTQAMTLDASGNLSLGNTNAFGFRLHTSAGTSVSGHLVSSTTTGVYTNWSDGSATDSPQVGGIGNNLAFRTTGSERARITSGGTLLIGRTADVSGTTRLGLDATASIAGFVSETGPTTSVTHGRFYNGNGNVGNISTSGSATTYSTSSDYRLKHDIAPMTGALDRVAALKPVTYKWNADGSGGEGFIAHELAEVVPDAVVGEKDAVDAEGNPQYQGIDTSFLVATLTAAIQEQQTMIQTLTERVALLEAK